MAQRTAGCIENNSDDLGNLVKQCHPSSLFCFNPFSQVALVVASELGVCSGFFVFLSRIVIYQKKAVIFKILNTEDWNLEEMPR